MGGKVNGKGLCKEFKFDYTNKWYKHNPESILENETHKIFWDFEIQTNHLISARRPNLEIVKKKKKRIVDFTELADHRLKLKKSKKRDKYQDFARELKKLWNIKVIEIPIKIGALGTVAKSLV